MDPAKLEKLGLNRNEAIVYLELTRLGQATAGELIKKTGFHRNIVYDNLEKLVDKGLVTYILEGKKKSFQVASPDMISEMLDEEQKELDRKKRTAEEVQKQIEKAYAQSSKAQEAVIFRGIRGLKVLLSDSLAAIEKGGEYNVFGAPQASVDIMSSMFWKNYNAKLMKKRILVRMVFNSDLKQWTKKTFKHPMTIVKYLPKHFDSLTETIIYKDRVNIIVWTREPTGVMIKGAEAAKAYKQYFDVLWKIAKA